MRSGPPGARGPASSNCCGVGAREPIAATGGEVARVDVARDAVAPRSASLPGLDAELGRDLVQRPAITCKGSP